MAKKAQFPFPLIAGSFQSLLSHPWQPSKTTGDTRVALNDVSPLEQVFALHYATQQLGYAFGVGESPALGKTLSLNPTHTKANESFLNVHQQVTACHHSAEAAAGGLSVHAFFQQQYRNAGVLDKWGSWHVGFNQHAFNAYKSPTHMNESQFMSYTHNLIAAYDGKHGTGHTSDCNYFTADGAVNRIKIVDRPETPVILNDLQDKLTYGLALCAKSDPRNQAALRNNLDKMLSL